MSIEITLVLPTAFAELCDAEGVSPSEKVLELVESELTREQPSIRVIAEVLGHRDCREGGRFVRLKK